MTALMDFISTRRLQLATDSWQHVSATVQAVLLATLLSVAIGVAVYRSRAGSAVATGLAATALTIPSFALLGLLIPVLGLGVLPTMTVLVIYAVLPILRNTIVRVSTQMSMGILAIAAYAKGPGLGNLIFAALSRVGTPTALPMALTATILIVVLALVLDALLTLLGRLTIRGNQ